MSNDQSTRASKDRDNLGDMYRGNQRQLASRLYTLSTIQKSIRISAISLRATALIKPIILHIKALALSIEDL